MLKHCTVEELEALCCELVALPLALFTENGHMRGSAKANRARDLCKNGEQSSIQLSLLWLFLTWNATQSSQQQDTVASSTEQVIKHRINDARDPIKRPKIRATKEMILQTTSEIFYSHPINKQRLVDIVADPINRFLSPKLVYQGEWLRWIPVDCHDSC